MITLILTGFALLVALAVVVGVVDAVQAPTWRRRAGDRRRRWEERNVDDRLA